MFQNFVVIIDILSLSVCIYILSFIISYRKKIDRTSLAFILVAFSVITLVSISNCIENFTGDIDLDKYEDFAEVLFIPLLIFSIYSLSLNRELKSRISAENKMQEESSRLAYALEGANEGLWDWNVTTGSVFFSAEFCKLLEYKPQSFISNKENWVKLVHPDHRKLEADFMYSFFNGNSDSQSIELMLLTGNNNYKWFLIKGKTVEKNPDGNPARISGIILDISKTKEYEEELVIAKEKAEESEKLKSAFLANMSHEIRTPLNGIIGFINLLQGDDTISEKQKEYLNYVNQNSNILLNLINDLIDVSIIESGQLQLHYETITLNKLMEDIYSLYKTTQVAKLQDISFSFSNGLPDNKSEIITDEIRLRQILTNLIDNAFKNTNNGTIKFGYTVGNDHEMNFYVEDSGTGIDKKDHEIIFERFRQADSGLKVKKGSGLGLAICKGLIAKLNGRISVESQLGKGSTFRFTVPYKPGIHTNPINDTTPEATDWKGYKVLIVEDDIISLKYLKEVLKDTGINMITTASGNDALHKYTAEQNVDLILLDLQLPDMDGYEVLKNLRKINPGLIIIAQTAFAGEKEKTKSIISGFNDYVTKPITPKHLINLISKHLNKQKQ